MRCLYLFPLVILTINSYSQGLITTDVDLGNFNSLEISRDDRIPLKVSLKEYTPITLKQEFSTCVAYSVANALTMLDAISEDEHNKNTITSKMYSPHWIYFLNKDKSDLDCTKGLALANTLLVLQDVGVAKLANVEYPDYHPFTEFALCNSYPPDADYDILQASLHKLHAAYTLTNIQDIKIALSNKMPVVFGMKVPASFESALGKSLWRPDLTDNADYGHAMVIVGYDDSKYGGAVEVFNSWGPSWGDNGYIWIKYDDLLKFITAQVYALKAAEKSESFGNPLSSKFNIVMDSSLIGSRVTEKVDSVSISKFNSIFRQN